MPRAHASSASPRCTALARPRPRVARAVDIVSRVCRSPMAEVIAKHWFAQRCGCAVDQLANMHGWDVQSGGLTDEVSRASAAA